MSGGGAERLPVPQLPVYIVLVAVVSLPRADLSLQMSFVFFSPMGVLSGAGEGGAGPGCPRCQVFTCNQVCSRRVFFVNS